MTTPPLTTPFPALSFLAFSAAALAAPAQDGVRPEASPVSAGSADPSTAAACVLHAEGEDVLFEVGGALVRFTGGARGDVLAYEALPDEGAWRLRLPLGSATFDGERLEIAGRRYTLRPDALYVFDAKGALDTLRPRRLSA